MAADDVSRALQAWRAAIREAEAQAPGTKQRTVLDDKAERARVAYQHTINADAEPGRGYESGPEGPETTVPDEATAGAS
jgi:hypothetical protein